MHPRGLNRSAQALYWYLKATGLLAESIVTVSWDSGVPEHEIYRAIREYPHVFEQDGESIRWTTATRGNRQHRLAQRVGRR